MTPVRYLDFQGSYHVIPNSTLEESTGCPTKNFPYLSCYFNKSAFYWLKMLKEICYAMLNSDLSICFNSVSAPIDFL